MGPASTPPSAVVRASSPRPNISAFTSDLWHLAQAATVLWLAAAFAVHVVRMAYVVATQGAAAVHPPSFPRGAGAAASVPIVVVHLPNPIADAVIACLVLGILTYIGLSYLCDSEWVEQTVQVQDCWEDVNWLNPFDWISVVVCVVKDVVQWVLQQICRWKEVFAIVLTVVCVVITLIAVAAA